MYCQIQLDNYNGTYYPGKSIKGRVVCTFDADADIKGKHENTSYNTEGVRAQHLLD
ncbi:unnamed protein product, partial [Callosobruchus maculatus]